MSGHGDIDLYARLTDDELAALRDPYIKLSESLDSWLDEGSVRTKDLYMGTFLEALRYRNTLVQLEEEAKLTPSLETLVAILHAEIRIFVLNAHVELRRNPFLPHWVEAVRRMQKELGEAKRAGTKSDYKYECLLLARCMFISNLLSVQDAGLEHVLKMVKVTPQEIWSLLQELALSLDSVPRVEQKFNVDEYVRMLVEDGVYDEEEARYGLGAAADPQGEVSTASTKLQAGGDSTGGPSDATSDHQHTSDAVQPFETSCRLPDGGINLDGLYATPSHNHKDTGDAPTHTPQPSKTPSKRADSESSSGTPEGTHSNPSDTPTIPSPSSTKNPTKSNTNGTSDTQPPLQTTSDYIPSSSTILELLNTDPQTAESILTHLPLTIPALDLLNSLLSSKALSTPPLDTQRIITSYLQHSLRQIEAMNTHVPAAPSLYSSDPESSSSTLRTNNLSSSPGSEETGYMERGRDAQVRAVKLLVLFMRSLLRNKWMSGKELAFEIQEICWRYLFIGD
ncbi:hypothetical protein M011DRAFT_341484 [Sporormia fimetaria CBS 119925]|uniref:Uncharacterized protein n=1 Tax=Sporormia fimetaria CBS 119925 TaxID=1340428 RepID=A0A6A6VGH5_9PLEO|nr:hypothetical protein M011DRAFT_341484 [Sporormia fimetaria CBS 119925]